MFEKSEILNGKEIPLWDNNSQWNSYLHSTHCSEQKNCCDKLAFGFY